MFSEQDSLATSFFDNLPLAHRNAAMEIFNFASLKQMLEMRLEGPDEVLERRYSLKKEQWTEVFDAVILTKLSYFKVRFGFPTIYLDRLVEIAGFCLGFPNIDAQNLVLIVQREHPVFADWLKQIDAVKRQNQLYEQKTTGR